MSEHYDYIVVGGGSAGCVIANRLVQDFGQRVLLLEAGRNDDHMLVRMPAGSFKMVFSGSEEFVRIHQSEPQSHLEGRCIALPQGRVVGGGSSVNAMAYIRGSRRDYARWVEATGGAAWGWDDLLPHFRRQEGNQRFENEAHSGKGPLKVSEQPYVVEGTHTFVRAMQDMGLPFCPDFSAGAHGGVGYVQVTLHQGERWSAARAFLDPIRSDDRLTLLTGAQVDRVLFEGERAFAVEYRMHGKVRRAHADREIILSAGAFITPKLLMLSGIGPAAHLAEHGIAIVSDQAGVGANLQDHQGAFLIASTRGEYGYHSESRGLRMIRNALQYMLFRTGPVSATGSESLAYVSIDSDPEDPDFQIYAIQAMWPGIADVEIQHGITFMANLMRPKSRGSVRLRSSDPADDPAIDCNWLSEPDDARLLLKGLKYLRSIVASEGMQAIIDRELAPGARATSDEELLQHVRATVGSNYHPCGTVRMGRLDDPMAPLTPDLRVKGVAGLRVMDASMMPSIISANTNATVMAVADRGVDLMMRG